MIMFKKGTMEEITGKQGISSPSSWKEFCASISFDDTCRGIVRSVSGEIRRFERRGVADLFSLVTDEPDFLRGAYVADKVIGRGAALLLVKGGVRQVYARVISSGALGVLRRAGIEVSFGGEVANIINRAGTDICPVEKLTAGMESPDEAYLMIKEFLKGKKVKE